MEWNQPLKPIGKTPASIRICEIWLGQKEKGSAECCYCGLPNVDWCYNCEQPICDGCSAIYAFRVSPPYGLRICKECATDNTMGSN